MHDDVIDLATWPRASAFQHFKDLAHPAFSVCVSLDVMGLKARAAGQGASLWLAYHHAALQAANEVEAFRLSWTGNQLLRLSTVHASTTVLREDGSFGIVSLPWAPELAEFAAQARPRIERCQQASGPLFAGDEPCAPESDLIHMTTVPWLAFSALHQARGRDDWRPKIAFGKIEQERLPVAIDVHHALMDGLDVARFVERLRLNLKG